MVPTWELVPSYPLCCSYTHFSDPLNQMSGTYVFEIMRSSRILDSDSEAGGWHGEKIVPAGKHGISCTGSHEILDDSHLCRMSSGVWLQTVQLQPLASCCIQRPMCQLLPNCVPIVVSPLVHWRAIVMAAGSLTLYVPHH